VPLEDWEGNGQPISDEDDITTINSKADAITKQFTSTVKFDDITGFDTALGVTFAGRFGANGTAGNFVCFAQFDQVTAHQPTIDGFFRMNNIGVATNFALAEGCLIKYDHVGGSGGTNIRFHFAGGGILFYDGAVWWGFKSDGSLTTDTGSLDTTRIAADTTYKFQVVWLTDYTFDFYLDDVKINTAGPLSSNNTTHSGYNTVIVGNLRLGAGDGSGIVWLGDISVGSGSPSVPGGGGSPDGGDPFL